MCVCVCVCVCVRACVCACVCVCVRVCVCKILVAKNIDALEQTVVFVQTPVSDNHKKSIWENEINKSQVYTHLDSPDHSTEMFTIIPFTCLLLDGTLIKWQTTSFKAIFKRYIGCIYAGKSQCQATTEYDMYSITGINTQMGVIPCD